MTGIWCCGGECGQQSSGTGGANNDAHWVFQGTGTVGFTTTNPRSGARAIRVSVSAQNGFATTSPASVGGTLLVLRYYLRVDTAPAASDVVLFPTSAGSVRYAGLY